MTLIFLRRTAIAVYATGGISVCLSVRLSVTLRYCVKTRERRGMPFSLPGSPVSLVFWLMGDDSVMVKFEYIEVDSCENSRAVHIWPHNSEKLAKKVQLTPIKSRPWASQRVNSRTCASPLTIPKSGSHTQICRFSQKCRPKTIKSPL